MRVKFSFPCAFKNSTPRKCGGMHPLAHTCNICIRRSESLATNLGRFIPGGKRERERDKFVKINERMREVKEG